MNEYPNDPGKQKLAMIGKGWIAKWLSDIQIAELEFFYEDSEKYSLDWGDFVEKDDVREKICKVRQEYRYAVNILEDEPEVFLYTWKVHAGLVQPPPGNRQWPDSFRSRVFICAYNTERSGRVLPRLWSDRFGGKPTIFRLVSESGNPNWKHKGGHPEEVAEVAHALIEKNGAATYRIKRHGAKRPTKYPRALLEDLGEEFGFSLTTAKRRLERSSFVLPEVCRL